MKKNLFVFLLYLKTKNSKQFGFILTFKMFTLIEYNMTDIETTLATVIFLLLYIWSSIETLLNFRTTFKLFLVPKVTWISSLWGEILWGRSGNTTMPPFWGQYEVFLSFSLPRSFSGRVIHGRHQRGSPEVIIMKTHRHVAEIKAVNNGLI